MASETIFQHWVFREFILPFLLVFFIVFAILEKTKLFGEGKQQLNAFTAAVIGLIVAGVAYPTSIIENMVLFLAVALVIVLVFLMLYAFVVTGKDGFEIDKTVKWVLVAIVSIAVILAVIWATGYEFGGVLDFLFNQDWSKGFWTNVLFVAMIVIVLVAVLYSKKDK